MTTLLDACSAARCGACTAAAAPAAAADRPDPTPEGSPAMTDLLTPPPTTTEPTRPELPPQPTKGWAWRPSQRWVLAVIATLVIGVDQGSKWWEARHASSPAVNRAASAGWPSWIGHLYSAPATGALLDAVGVVVVVLTTRWLLRHHRPWAVLVGGGLVLAGEASNVADRTVTHWFLVPGQPRGAVDWFALGPVATGNVADLAELAGWAVLLVAAVVWAARRWRGRTAAALVLAGLVTAGAVGTARIDRANTFPPPPPAGTLLSSFGTRLPAPAPGVTLTEDTRSVSRDPKVAGPVVTATFSVAEPNGLRAQVPARFVSSALGQHGRLPTFVYEAAVAQVPIANGAGTMWVVVPLGRPSTAEPILVQATSNIVVYLPRLPSSAADLTTAKTEAVEAVAWAAKGWGAPPE